MREENPTPPAHPPLVAGAADAASPRPSHGGITGGARAALATAGALAVVALLAALLVWARSGTGGIGNAAARSPTAAAASTSAAASIPAGWQTYRDAQALFSIQAPPDWSVTSDTNSGSFGDGSGSYSFTGEDIWLGVPPQDVDGLGVWVNVTPLTTDYARQSVCRSLHEHFSPNTVLAGLPAYYDSGDMWLLDTHDAHFQVNAHYPGGPESPHSSPPITNPPPTPTPVPPTQLAANRQTVGAVLASFTLTQPAPLTCVSA
jgi:hypothetical protein